MKHRAVSLQQLIDHACHMISMPSSVGCECIAGFLSLMMIEMSS